MSKVSTNRLATAGLMAALVVVGTMLVQVPTPGKGYIHIGDSMVYLSGILLGPVLGALAAACGSLLADLFSGYGIYAPATFIIKGLDAWIVGFLYLRFVRQGDPLAKKVVSFVIAVIFGGTIMVTGYLAFESMLYGFPVAIASVLANITQAIGGGILAIPLLLALDRFIKR